MASKAGRLTGRPRCALANKEAGLKEYLVFLHAGLHVPTARHAGLSVSWSADRYAYYGPFMGAGKRIPPGPRVWSPNGGKPRPCAA